MILMSLAGERRRVFMDNLRLVLGGPRGASIVSLNFRKQIAAITVI